MFKKSIICGLIGIACSASSFAAEDINSVNEAVNEAGKIRAASQRMGRAYMEKCSGVEGSDKILEAGINSTEEARKKLLNYKPLKNNKDLWSKFEGIFDDWTKYKKEVIQSCDGGRNKIVYDMSEKYGSATNNFVANMQKSLGTGAGTKLVNQAGVQRYWSLAMAKHSQAQQAGALTPAEASTKIDPLKAQWLKSQEELAAALPKEEALTKEAFTKFNVVTGLIGKGNAKALRDASESLLETLHAQVKAFEKL